MPLSSHIAPDPHGAPTREQIERARSMYAERFTVSRILAHCGMSLGTLYYWLDGGPREDGAPPLPPIPRRRKIVGARRRPLSGSRVSLANRIWRTAERQARDIEERLARPAAPPPERDVRMLSMLVRTMRDLAGFDAVVAVSERDNDAEQVDIDEFRMELAARIKAFVDERQAATEAGEQAGEAGAVSAGQSENHTPAPDAPRS